MSITTQIKNRLHTSPLLRKLNSLRYSSLDMIYKIEDLNPKYYQQVRNLGDQELEHQIGRLINYYQILKKIKSEGIGGDIIEFGVWKGFSLLWIAYLYERLGMFDKKIVGLDSFEGLPNKEGTFSKKAFSDTSLSECRNNIYRSKDLYSITKQNIHIEKFIYNEKLKILETLKKIKIKKVSFINIDCDLSSSIEDVFRILVEGKLLNDYCFVLIDDYGCDTNLHKTVDKILVSLKKEWYVKLHSKTKLTRNFELKSKV